MTCHPVASTDFECRPQAFPALKYKKRFSFFDLQTDAGKKYKQCHEIYKKANGNNAKTAVPEFVHDNLDKIQSFDFYLMKVCQTTSLIIISLIKPVA